MKLLRFLGIPGVKHVNRLLTLSLKKPLETQQKLLSKILKVNKNTRFGKTHNFERIKSIRQYQSEVSPHSYEYFQPYIDDMTRGETSILIPGNPVYWGVTAGSTGEPKIVPITRNSIRNAMLGSLKIYLSYIAENPRVNSKLLDGVVCFFNADPSLKYINGIPVGFGTGVLSKSTANQFWSPLIKNLSYSMAHLYQIKDTKKRVERLAFETTQKDIRVFGGVTSVIIMFIEDILKYAQRKNPNIKYLKEVFPNIQLSVCGGESARFYEPRFNMIVGKKIDFREVYGATEEIIAVQLQEEPGFTPLLDVNFLEFIPVNSDECLLIHEVERGVDYRIIITNYNGFYCYKIGDVIRFTQMDPPLLVFSHREGSINIGSANTTVKQINSSFADTNKEHDCALFEYCVVGKYDPLPHFVIVVEFLTGKEPQNEVEYLKSFTKYLEKYNPTYSEIMQKTRSMAKPVLWIVEKGTFKKIEEKKLAEGARLGQQKVKHLSLDLTILKQFEEHVEKEIRIN
ncbi:MAG: GH3 auxin-responsive promoter family protein [Candidatus Hodarchaeota archaeon]